MSRVEREGAARWGNPRESQPLEYVIVGGGLHGVHVAARLLGEGDVAPESLRIVDFREELLASFAEKAARCGMESLRSSYLHHLGKRPFDLEGFTMATGREDELHGTGHYYPPRPSLSLFLDHARQVVTDAGLASLHVQARVTGIARDERVLRVATEAGPLYARRCVLALGRGDRYARPDWARTLPAETPAWHVWDEAFDPATAAAFPGRTYVVGGGITAVQVAVRLAKRGADVSLLSRRKLTEQTLEADLNWQVWSHLQEQLHVLPPGSKARYDRVAEVRTDGTVPPYQRRRLESAVRAGELRVERGEILAASGDGDGVTAQLDDGSLFEGVQVVLATGFAAGAAGRVAARLTDDLALETGYGGLPVLDDATLEWRATDGSPTGIHVVSAQSAGSLGPLAGNIVGARLAADCLLRAHERRTVDRTEPIEAVEAATPP